MKRLPLISSFGSTPRRKLYIAIAAQMIASASAQAAPAGGTIVGGSGVIEQLGADTTIIQNTDRLAIDWDTFNIGAEERVQFIQPDADSIALNRILGNEASQIFGRLDANGHVILMNPNGVLFGESATVNVGGLVAAGLNINADDFINGEMVFQALEGKDGAVINQGIINAATGGNVALIGKQVDNQGLISAKLGSVTLAAGKEAVLTFDNQGLIGVRVSKEILQSELGVDAAVSNSGEITAEGGRVLLTGSASQDIFSRAVNADGLNAKTSVVMHEDGSFTLGAGADVVNTGTISTSSTTAEAGDIVVLGENVNSSGTILANSKTAAGDIEIHSRDTTLLTENSTTSAINDGAGSGGQIKILGDRVGVLDQSQIHTSGTHGGGDIHIGGGFQGKETQLRNASRTAIGKDTLIEANALTEGDGGDVIVWADETTSFTGEINVRGGELGGDGGFVEVSGKENLRFLGSVDRTAVRGENGTLLLDPEAVVIVPEVAALHDDELVDGTILFSDEPDAGSSLFLISDVAIARALATGDVFISASKRIADSDGLQIAVEDPNSTSSLVLESGGSVYFSQGLEIDLGLGDFVAVGSIESLCQACSSDEDITLFAYGTINTKGNIYFLSSNFSTFHESTVGTNQIGIPNNIYMYSGGDSVFVLGADLEVAGSITVETLERPTLTSITLPSGLIYQIPKLRGFTDEVSDAAFITGSVLKAEITVGKGLFIDANLIAGNGVLFSGIVVNSRSQDAQLVINSQDAIRLPEIGYDASGNPTFNPISVNVYSAADIYANQNISTFGGSIELTGANINFGESVAIDTTGVAGQGDVFFESVGDINLGQIFSGGNLVVRSTGGEINAESAIDIEGDALFDAATRINLTQDFSILSDGDIKFSAAHISSPLFTSNPVVSTSGSLSYETSGQNLVLGGVYKADSLSVKTNGGIFYVGTGEVQVNKDIVIDLGEGRFEGQTGYMVFDSGSFSALGRELWMSDVVINTDVNKGTGDISLISSGSRFGGSDISLPSINPEGSHTTGDFFVQAPGDVVAEPTVISKVLPHSDLSGSARFEVGGNLYLPEIAATNAQGQRDISINVGGFLIQSYDVRTGGGSYTATAEAFQFGDNVEINTEIDNPILDGAVGGNITLNSATDLALPSIRTRSDCLDTSSCGTLNVSASSVDAKKGLHIFGDANFHVNGELAITNENFFSGFLSVNAEHAAVNFSKSLKLGEWNLSSSDGSAVVPTKDDGDLSIIGNRRLDIVGSIFFGASYIELKNTETRIGQLMLNARSVDIEYASDLNLEQAYLVGGSNEISSFKVGGDLNVVSDGYVVGGFLSTLPILNAESAAPIVIDAGGNINLGGSRNRLSSIKILNAQDVEVFNNGTLALDGINAESLSLNILGDINQTDVLNITGETSILAAVGTSIDLSNPLNDFNTLSVQAEGAATINIADANSVRLADIELNGAGQGGDVSISASVITQEESSHILLQDAARLNLQADTITLGADGSATVDIYGAVLSGAFNNDLNIQGAIRGVEGVEGTSSAGLYFSGSDAANLFEVAEGASISGVFSEDSIIALGDGDDISNIAGDIAVTVDGGAGDDRFTLNVSGVSVTQILGGQGVDTLIGSDTNNQWTITGEGDGSLSSGEANTLFLGVERFQGGSEADDFFVEAVTASVELDGGEGINSLAGNSSDPLINNQWIIEGVNSGTLNEFVDFSSVENLIGNDGADTVTFVEGAQIGRVSTGLGDDTFILADNITAGLLDAGDGQDTLDLNGRNYIVNYLNELISNGGRYYAAAGFEIYRNEGGSKTVVGVDGYDAEWVIDADGSVIVTALQGDVTEINRFTDVTSVKGASGDDTFILQGGYITDGIVGGQGGKDTLVADAGLLKDWSISGRNSGVVRVVDSGREQLFEAIANLVGGSGDDIFNILAGAEFDGAVSGGEGVNSLAVMDPTATSVWTIAEVNNVLVESTDSVVSKIQFSEIQSLVGNENEDVLDLSAAPGSVDLELKSAAGFVFENFDVFVSANGAAITGSNNKNLWNVDSGISSIAYSDGDGKENVVKFFGFSVLYGGNDDDTFIISGVLPQTGSGGPAVVVGNAGVDTVEIRNQGTDSLLFMYNGMDYLRFTDASDFLSNGRDRYDYKAELDAAGKDAYMFGDIDHYIGSDARDIFFTYSALYSRVYDGGGGEDYLFGWNYPETESDGQILWNITGDYAGNLDGIVEFHNIENLYSDYGQSSNDIFNVEAGTTIGTLFAGAGEDLFIIGEGSFVGAVLGADGIDSIQSSGALNTWVFNAAGGTLNGVQFSGIEILNGGSGSDDFILTSSTTEVAQIHGGTGSSSLTAFDQSNSWNISADGGSLNATLQFENMTHLIGGSDVDVFTINSDVPSLAIDGGLGNNELIAADSADNMWLIDGNNSGLVNSNLAFERIQNLFGGTGNDTFTFTESSAIEGIHAGAGNDTFILANNITAGILDGGEGVDTLDRGGLNSIMTYLRDVIGGDAIYTAANIETETSIGGSTTVVGVDGYNAEWNITGDGALSVTATASDGTAVTNQFNGVTRVEGGSGLDTFVLLEGGALVDGIVGGENDHLQGSETTNTWIVNAANGGELSVQESDTRLRFEGIGHLYGGNLSDTFDIASGGSISGSIYGGGGADSLVVSDAEAINDWQLGQENSVGLVAYFREIEALVGNGNDDMFTFSAGTDVTSISGGAGANSALFDTLWSAGDVIVDLGRQQINSTILFDGITHFSANGDGENVLIGADGNNVWTLDGVASGAVASTEGAVDFIGFQSLLGGAASDDFVLTVDAAGFTGLDGSLGENTITAADQLNQWLLDDQGGTLNSTRFTNIEALTGGALEDSFVLVAATSQAQTIDGGAGANRLTGYDQVNAWNVTGDNAGDLTGLASFSNIQTLVGGAQADTFVLSAGVNLSEIYAGAGNDAFVIGEGVTANNLYGEAGDDSFDVGLGLQLSGVLDGGSEGEVDGDFIDLSKFTLLDATEELESVVGFAFRNFERIEQPNNAGVYFGGNGTNFWYITGANEGRLEIRDGDKAGVYEFSGVHSVLGGEGEDVFIFANDDAAVSTLIDGGTGAGANTLDLSAQGLINRWLIDGTNSGLVSNSSNASGNVFTNIAYLIGGSNQDTFELHSGGGIDGGIDGGLGADELRVVVEQTSHWQLGGTGGHEVTGVASFTNIETLIGGAGTDNFDILASLTDVAELRGGAGSDAVNFLYDTPVEVDLARGLAGGLLVEAIERFSSAAVGSTFRGHDQITSWSIDGQDQGVVDYRLADGDAIRVAFDGFGHLVGGAADDQFLFAEGGALSGTLEGGDGSNSVDLQALRGELHVAVSPEIAIASGLESLTLVAIDQLIGNGQTWLYGASDRSYTWVIDGARSGHLTSTLVDDDNRLLAFENLSAIRGGAHDDIFQVTTASPLLSLDGGEAVTADFVDYSQVNGNLSINLTDALTGQNGAISGVEGIRGNNAGPSSLHTAQLVGPDSGALWTIGGVSDNARADGVNDGQVTFGEQTVTFIDFNRLTGGAGVDTFNQLEGVILGTLEGGAGNDIFNVHLAGANAGTSIIGGAGVDSLILRGGDETGQMTYTAAANGGEFDYSAADVHYKLSHEGVETIRENSLATTLNIRGSSAVETFSLANGRFWVNSGDVIEYSNKRDLAVHSGINDIIEIADHLVLDNSLTLANGTVIANDPAGNSITANSLILDSVREVGLASARLRTNVDDLLVRNSAGDIYLQEQNGLNLAEFSANRVFDLVLLNGDLTNSAPLLAADVFRAAANNGDITLTGTNQLRDDVAVTGERVEIHNASTLTLIEVNAEDLYLRTQRGIEGDGPLRVAGLTDIDAQGDVLLDFATNDFNRVRVTNAVNLTLVDENAIELLDINASGKVIVRSTNAITLNDAVTGGNGVEISSGTGSINQNGDIATNSGSIVVAADKGEVNLDEDARIVANGGSVSIKAGEGDVNMGSDTRIAAHGGDVSIDAAGSVVVAEVVSSGKVQINAGGGNVSDGNGGATNVTAGELEVSANTGFGDEDALETEVSNIDITTNTGNVAVNNTGDVAVGKVSTGEGDISLANDGNVELGGGSVVAENGTNGGSVKIDVSHGSVSQRGSTQVPAVKSGGVVVINAPDGAVGEGGGLRVDAPFVEVIAAIKAGNIFVNPGADKIEYFSGSFKFDDQLLAVEPLDDINPAIFANVKSYSFNDISLLLPRDQLYDEDDEE